MCSAHTCVQDVTETKPKKKPFCSAVFNCLRFAYVSFTAVFLLFPSFYSNKVFARHRSNVNRVYKFKIDRLKLFSH